MRSTFVSNRYSGRGARSTSTTQSKIAPKRATARALLGAFELKPEHPSVSLGSIAHTQLDSRGLKKLGTAKALPLAVGHVESESEQLEPGSSAQGVVAIRQDLKGPAVLQLVFESGLKATFVM